MILNSTRKTREFWNKVEYPYLKLRAFYYIREY